MYRLDKLDHVLDQKDFRDTDSHKYAIDIYTAASIGCIEYFYNSLPLSDLLAPNSKGWTTLMYAAYNNHANIVTFLANKLPTVDTANLKGQTALMLAASCGNNQCLQILLQKTTDVELSDCEGWTALYHAAYSCNKDSALLLLNYKAKLDVFDKVRGMTPLMVAAECGNLEIAVILLKNGAKLNLKSREGFEASDIAAKNNQKDMILLFQNYIKVFYLNKSSIKPITSPTGNLSSSSNCNTFSSSSSSLETPNATKSSSKSLPDVFNITSYADLGAFLVSIGLEKYFEVFVEQEVDLVVFLSFNEKDLKDVGISLVGPRRKMITAINKWHERAPSSLVKNSSEAAFLNRVIQEKKELTKSNAELKEDIQKLKGSFINTVSHVQENLLHAVANMEQLKVIVPYKQQTPLVRDTYLGVERKLHNLNQSLTHFLDRHNNLD